MRRHGAVAAGHGLTAGAAADVLREGGNAFDAAIAALWMACVCEPVLASPGGGGYMAVWSNGRARVFDFFPLTPKRKRAEGEAEYVDVVVDFGTAEQEFHIGAGTSATPGFVPGLFAIHDRLGSLPMRRLAEPAVAAASGGVEVTPLQAYLFGIVAPIYRWSGEAAALFAPDGRSFEAGDVLRNPDLAAAIEAIAREGRRIATEGEIARAMVAESERHDGHLQMADLAEYAAALRDPLAVTIGGHSVHLNPPPALGGALVHAMLAACGPAGLADAAGRARAIDRVDRFWREDPVNAARLLATPTAWDGATAVASRGTTHISVVDGSGNAAAVTVSNGEGNGRLVSGCGFMMNNILGEDDVNRDGAYGWRPGSRLGSMMAPAIAADRDGRLIALGSGGSSRIRTAVLQALLNRCGRDAPLEQAILAPRLHVEQGHLDFEDFFSLEDRDALTAAFPTHRAWPERNLYFGGVHGAEVDPRGGFDAAGDPRRGGVGLIV